MTRIKQIQNHAKRESEAMGIDTPSETIADLRVGPTSNGMVRIHVHGEGIDLPMDFAPEEAVDIAQELMAAAEAARAAGRDGG